MSKPTLDRTPEETAALRARTMQLRALNRLAEYEVLALGDALGELVGVEAGLVRELATMRLAAEREAQARRKHGLPGLGVAGKGYEAARGALAAITDTRDSLLTLG